MKLKGKAKKEFDAAMQKALYGYVINIMDIGKAVREAEAQLEQGMTLEQATKAGVEKYAATGRAAFTGTSKSANLRYRPTSTSFPRSCPRCSRSTLTHLRNKSYCVTLVLKGRERMEKAKRFRAEVIAVHPGEGKAAVRFKWRGRERIECVKLYLGPECFALTVGMKGWAAYHMTQGMGLWGFEPFKGYVNPDTLAQHVIARHPGIEGKAVMRKLLVRLGMHGRRHLIREALALAALEVAGD